MRATAIGIGAVAAALLLCGLPSRAEAQARAALVLEGARGPTRAQLREPLAGALANMGYAVIDDGALQSARAFSSIEGALDATTAQQLRGAVQASTLVLVALRLAGPNRYYVSVQRHSDAGTQQEFGEQAVGDIVSFAVATLYRMEGRTPPSAQPVVVAPVGAAPAIGAPVTAAPVAVAPVAVAPVVAPAPAPPVTSPNVPVAMPAVGVGAAVPVGQGAGPGAPSTPMVGVPVAPQVATQPTTVAAVGPQTAVPAGQPGVGAPLGPDAPQYAEGAVGVGQPLDEPSTSTQSSDTGTFETVGYAGLAVFAGGWLLTPIIGGLAICNVCDSHVGYGFIPLAGPFINLQMTPGVDDGLQVYYGLMGVLQLAGFATAAVFLTLAQVMGGGSSADREAPQAGDVMPVLSMTTEGGLAGFAAAF